MISSGSGFANLTGTAVILTNVERVLSIPRHAIYQGRLPPAWRSIYSSRDKFRLMQVQLARRRQTASGELAARDAGVGGQQFFAKLSVHADIALSVNNILKPRAGGLDPDLRGREQRFVLLR